MWERIVEALRRHAYSITRAADEVGCSRTTVYRVIEASLELLAMVRELLDLTASIRLRAEADLGGALEFAHAAFRGAEANVRVNLPGLRKEARGEQLEQRWRGLAATFDVQYETSRQQLARRLQG